MAKIRVTVFRHKMVCGGSSYDVLIARDQKRYYPITGFSRATTVSANGTEYYSPDNFFRTPELDQLPCLTTQRLNAFDRLHKFADRFKLKIAQRVFPELRKFDKFPSLWTDETHENSVRHVDITVPDSFVA